jgi:hypothetical protein
MTTLHDQLRDAVDDVRADLPALTLAAQRRGLSQRRRRRALAAVGTAAAALLVGAAVVSQVGGGRPGPMPVATEAPSAVVTDTTVPLDGRATAGQLADLASAAGLHPSTSRGQDPAGGSPDTWAQIGLADVPGATLEVNVQRPGPDVPDGVSVHRRDDGKVGTDRWVAVRVDHAAGLLVAVALVVPEGAPRPLDDQQLAQVADAGVWGFHVAAPAPAAPSPYTPM